MYFNDLPDDIAVLVLENCMDKCAELHVWKNMLVYLKVCRRWSKLAMPIVYRNVVVKVGAHSMEQVECAERVVSNASIAVSRNAQHVVKHLHIEIEYLQHPFHELMAVLDTLRENKVWKPVHTLTIELDCIDHDESMPELQYLPPVELETKISETVFQLLPSLKNISFANTDDNVFICSMYSKLAQNYLHQIRSLASQHPLMFAMQQLPHTLTWLEISLQFDINSYIPQLCAGSLKFLRLTNVPQNYMWDCFGTQSCIDFDSLETLHIDYQYSVADQPMDMCGKLSGFRAQFFKLQRLYVGECSGHCCLLECSLFKMLLQLIEVRGSGSAVRALSQMRMPKIRVLKMVVNQLESTNGPQLTAVLARVFKNASALKIEFYATAKYVNFDTKLSCPSLSCVSIHMPTDASWLIELIKKFRCLEYVALENMVFNNIPKEARNVRSGKYITEYLEPLDTRIRHLHLKHSSDYYTVREARVFMQYVVLLIPSLQMLATVVDTIHEISDVVNDYMPFYPHLRNIEFCNVNIM